MNTSPTRAVCTLLAGIVVFGLAAAPARAGCTDPPRPGVNWQRCSHDERPFVNANLSGANLRETRMTWADLSGANLSKMDARRAKFLNARLVGARLDGANLTEADFTKADLSGASLKGAILRGTHLFRANLRGADFTGARLARADLLNADLSGAIWTDGKTVCAEGSISQCK